MASRKRQVARSLTIGRRPRNCQEGTVLIMTAEQRIATVDLQFSIFNHPTIRSSKKVNSKNELPSTVHRPCLSFLEKNEFENESISYAPAPERRLHRCSLAPELPRSPASLRSSKKMNSKTNHGPRSTVHFIRYPEKNKTKNESVANLPPQTQSDSSE